MPRSHAGVEEKDARDSETYSGPSVTEAGETAEHDAGTPDPRAPPDGRLFKGADKLRTCRTCYKTFATLSRLARHACGLTANRKPERSRYRCRKHACTKAFARPSQLVRHMASHVGEKPFKCPDCGRRFGRGSHLETHRRLHTGEKPFECSVCNKSFTQKSGLIVHVRRHTGERPYKCDKCGDAFRTAAHLLSHQAVEAGEGRHVCATCRKSFTSVSALRRHENVHRESHHSLVCSVCSGSFACELLDSDVRVFHCAVCDVMFTDMASFEDHCEEHRTEKRVFDVEEGELDEEEEEEEDVKQKNSARDPPFRPHVATSMTRYVSEVSTRSKTRARSGADGSN